MKFCVIGLGRFGYSVAATLAEYGMEVLAIDRNESIVDSIKDKVTQAVCMKVRSVESLEAVGIEDVATAIVTMGEENFESILITALLKKQLEIPTVIARSTSKIHEKILLLVGADRVISPEIERGRRLAKSLSLPFLDVVNITEKFAITQMKAPKRFIGKTIGELELRKNNHVACIGVQKGIDIKLIELNYVILENDKLVFAGEEKDLELLAHL